MLDLETINRIICEETMNLHRGEKDSVEEAEFRERVRRDIQKIKAQGGEVQLPNE